MAADQLDHIFDEAGKEWNVDPNLLRAVARQESGGTRNPDRTTSKAGAYGRMQIIGPTARGLGITDPDDPVQNIYGGAKYLSEALDAEKSPEDALRYYHGGPKWRDAYGPESKGYAPGVTAHYQKLTAATPPLAAPAKETPAMAKPAAAPAPEDDPVAAFLKRTTTPAPEPEGPATPGGGDDPMAAFLKRTAVDNPALLNSTVGARRGDIDPITGKPFQFMTAADESNPVVQSMGKAVRDAPAGDAGTQAKVSLATDLEQQRRIAARDLFPDKPIAEALSRVFIQDGRLAVVKENGEPAFLSPAPNSGAPGVFDERSPNSLMGSIRTDNPLLRGSALAGEVPAALGGAVAGVASGGNPLIVGVGAGGGDQARQYLASKFDPQPEKTPNDWRQSATTAAEYTAGEGLLRFGARMLPSNIARPGELPPSSSPFHPAQAEADAPRFAPEPNKLFPEGFTAREAQAKVAAPPAEGVAPAPSSPTGIPVTAPEVAGMTAAERAEVAAIPDKLPTRVTPILTQSQADDYADKVIKHFAGIGPKDATPEHLPGAHRTLADTTGNAGLATLQRGFEAGGDSGGFQLIRDKNIMKRTAEFEDIKKTPAHIERAEAGREQATSALREAAFANKKDVDAKPLLEEIDSVIASPEGKRTAVDKTLSDIRARLHNKEGVLETDPEQLYGVRKHINDLLAPAAQAEKSELRAAAANLIKIRNQLDEAIEGGAPGFRKYIETYSELSRPIDGMRMLQGLNLTSMSGHETLGKVDSAIKLIERQQKLPGARPADSITDEQLGRLRSLREDLRQQEKTRSGGKVNSGTFQDMATNARVGTLAGNPIVGLGAGHVSNMLTGIPGGEMIGFGASMALKMQQERAQAMLNRALKERLMNIDGKGMRALQRPD